MLVNLDCLDVCIDDVACWGEAGGLLHSTDSMVTMLRLAAFVLTWWRPVLYYKSNGICTINSLIYTFSMRIYSNFKWNKVSSWTRSLFVVSRLVCALVCFDSDATPSGCFYPA